MDLALDIALYILYFVPGLLSGVYSVFSAASPLSFMSRDITSSPLWLERNGMVFRIKVTLVIHCICLIKMTYLHYQHLYHQHYLHYFGFIGVYVPSFWVFPLFSRILSNLFFLVDYFIWKSSMLLLYLRQGWYLLGTLHNTTQWSLYYITLV